MKRYLLPITLLLIVALAIPAAAKIVVQNLPIEHRYEKFQAHPGEGGELCYLGYLGAVNPTITSVPGILCIEPGTDPITFRINWSNYVAAASQDATRPLGGTVEAPIDYVIKNVVLRKVTPEIFQCADIFPAHTITQQGTDNIRLWWPLMYEVPSTTFTLTITWGTKEALNFRLDPPTEPGEPAGVYSYVHQDVWVWHVDADINSLADLLELFHELPFGTDEVPLISDEVLYTGVPEEMYQDLNGNDEWDLGEPYFDVNLNGVWDAEIPGLMNKLLDAEQARVDGDIVLAREILADFEMEVNDACIDESPVFPNPTGPGTGIAENSDNPACCKILADVEYILNEKL